MPRRCCIPGCNSNTDSKKPYTNIFCFPKNLERRQHWFQILKSENFVPRDVDVICMKHFPVHFITKKRLKIRPGNGGHVLHKCRFGLIPEAYPCINIHPDNSATVKSNFSCTTSTVSVGIQKVQQPIRPNKEGVKNHGSNGHFHKKFGFVQYPVNDPHSPTKPIFNKKRRLLASIQDENSVNDCNTYKEKPGLEHTGKDQIIYASLSNTDNAMIRNGVCEDQPYKSSGSVDENIKKDKSTAICDIVKPLDDKNKIPSFDISHSFKGKNGVIAFSDAEICEKAIANILKITNEKGVSCSVEMDKGGTEVRSVNGFNGFETSNNIENHTNPEHNIHKGGIEVRSVNGFNGFETSSNIENHTNPEHTIDDFISSGLDSAPTHIVQEPCEKSHSCNTSLSRTESIKDWTHTITTTIQPKLSICVAKFDKDKGICKVESEKDSNISIPQICLERLNTSNSNYRSNSLQKVENGISYFTSGVDLPKESRKRISAIKSVNTWRTSLNITAKSKNNLSTTLNNDDMNCDAKQINGISPGDLNNIVIKKKLNEMDQSVSSKNLNKKTNCIKYRECSVDSKETTDRKPKHMEHNDNKLPSLKIVDAQLPTSEKIHIKEPSAEVTSPKQKRLCAIYSANNWRKVLNLC